jgi:hypothetical protein
MKTITVITILALLTISGAVISDQILTSQERAVLVSNWNRWGTTGMLSVDQFLRLISVPALIAAFLIASQVSSSGLFHLTPSQIASEWTPSNNYGFGAPAVLAARLAAVPWAACEAAFGDAPAGAFSDGLLAAAGRQLNKIVYCNFMPL